MPNNLIKREVLFEKHTPKIYTKMLLLNMLYNSEVKSDNDSVALIQIPKFWDSIQNKVGKKMIQIDLKGKKLEVSIGFLQQLIKQDEKKKQIDQLIWSELCTCLIDALISMGLPDSTDFEFKVNITW